jgi:predicted ArsR family transcriptional regulator
VTTPIGDDAVMAISALGEPTRRALYEYVSAAGTWVGRDEAADALDLERATAAHHLDRLAADGLLEVDFQRTSGKQGPGAGRPAKVYRRAGREFAATLPPRDYELAGRVLAEAVDRSRTEGTDISTALERVARDEGTRLAGTSKSVIDVLLREGYEPVREADGTIVLRNCPFHHLAQEHTDLICGLNLALLKGTVDALADARLAPCLDPAEGRCCVKLQPRPKRAS